MFSCQNKRLNNSTPNTVSRNEMGWFFIWVCFSHERKGRSLYCTEKVKTGKKGFGICRLINLICRSSKSMNVSLNDAFKLKKVPEICNQQLYQICSLIRLHLLRQPKWRKCTSTINVVKRL